MGKGNTGKARIWKELPIDAKFLCGVDEVGRGCLAGPVVSCAVVMKQGELIEGVRDSKKLTASRREFLAPKIRDSALAVGFGVLDAAEIDRIGIRKAVQETMRMAIGSLLSQGILVDHIAVDFEIIPVDIPQTAVVHGDDTVYEIACASILAKVYRDSMAADWDRDFPGYFFSANKGYGTKAHMEGIRKLGLSPIHRRSFCRKIQQETVK